MRAVRWCGNRRLQGGNRLQTVSEVRGRGAAPFKFRRAVRDHWVLAPTPVIVLMAVAGASAFQRTPTDTAESRPTLGQLDAAAQAPSYVTAAQGLAATDAQAIHAGTGTWPAAKALHIATARGQQAPAGHPGGSDTPVPDRCEGPVPQPKRSSSPTPLHGRWCATWTGSTHWPPVSRRRWRRTSARRRNSTARRSPRAGAVALRAPSERPHPHGACADPSAVRLGQAPRDGARRGYDNPKRMKPRATCSRSSPGDSAANDRSSMAQKLFFIAALVGLSIGMALAVRSGTWPVDEPAQRVRAAPAA